MKKSKCFIGVLKITFLSATLITVISCTPLPISDVITQADDLSASRGGGCPEGVRCSKKPIIKDYDQWIAQGNISLKKGNPTKAIDDFKQALLQTGNDSSKLQEVYGKLGLAYIAAADNPTAQAYLEEAGAKKDAPAWIKDAYKHLILSQQFMTAEYMEKSLDAEKAIDQDQAKLLIADTEDSSEEYDSAKYYTRGLIIGKPATMEVHRPTSIDTKPKSSTPASKRPAHPGPTLLTKSHGETPSSEISLDVHINFGSGSAELTPQGEKQADELGKLLQQKLQDSNQIVVLVGHTDMIGGEEYNDVLSEKRASAVKSYLISKFPELKGKLSERGMGKRQPLFTEMDQESQSLNRRVEVKLSNRAE